MNYSKLLWFLTLTITLYLAQTFPVESPEIEKKDETPGKF